MTITHSYFLRMVNRPHLRRQNSIHQGISHLKGGPFVQKIGRTPSNRVSQHLCEPSDLPPNPSRTLHPPLHLYNQMTISTIPSSRYILLLQTTSGLLRPQTYLRQNFGAISTPTHYQHHQTRQLSCISGMTSDYLESHPRPDCRPGNRNRIPSHDHHRLLEAFLYRAVFHPRFARRMHPHLRYGSRLMELQATSVLLATTYLQQYQVLA